MISNFNSFLNGDNKTIFKNLEQQFELSHTKLKPKLPLILNFTNSLEGGWRGTQKWLLPLNINITIFKTKLLSSIAWIDPNLPICYGISNPPKFNMD